MSTSSVLWDGWRDPGRSAAGSAGLWVFMGVVSTLFALFLTAYVLRMAEDDWSPIALPGQLWLSTMLLAAGSVAMQWAAHAARATHWPRARVLLALGAAIAIGFVASQLWAWSALTAREVRLASNPAASFFYLLSAMHGLHVLGGLFGWAAAWNASRPGHDPARGAAWIALCARYWHFLFAVWAVLFAAMAGLTPEFARAVCGRA